MTESQFQSKIVKYAKDHGWLVHATRTHHSAKRRGHHVTGFPDLVLSHPSGHIIFAEVKSDIGTMSHEQQRWMKSLWNAEDSLNNPPQFRVRVWSPANLQRIKIALALGDDGGAIQ